MNQRFYARGKLLLTAEYFVLDGAPALALPVSKGQSLELRCAENAAPAAEKMLHWQSFDDKGECWFEACFAEEEFEIGHSSDANTAKKLQQILLTARNLNPDFKPFATWPALSASSRLDFPRNWGLGTSSTLVYLLAAWAYVDPFELQFRTFGGSGYDIACAGAEGPILYFLKNGKPHLKPCNFRPVFRNSLFFIYLEKKQDSRKGIARYREAAKSHQQAAHRRQAAIEKIADLTRSFLEAHTLRDFEKLIVQHESIVSETLDMPRAKELYFPDFWGEIKSLGAWGGDFILATSHRPASFTRQYFSERGFSVFIPYADLIFSRK